MTRLKQLEINGFKSFANPTTFVFDDGITAIIGPNGSGKSNVAEALRWVLGEQQYSALRGRRTEDVIFAGSEKRGRLGMAEASLTIDNSDGGLPIEFSEITITRRAHRSGENHYLINGNRVRLKDVQQLTAPLGQAHTIIGQGLVDAVLSQRPEDRLGLFEHAAGISGLRLQATGAERGLLEAEDNARRLRDILSELEPRVRSLSRRAKQAREYEGVRDQLLSLQRGYYGALWRESLSKQRASRQALRVAEEGLEAAEIERTTAAGHLATIRSREREISTRQAELAGKLSEHQTALASAQHRLDLILAESRSTGERIDDLHRTRADLEAQRAARADDLVRLDKELSRLRDELAELERLRADRETATRAARNQRTAIEEQIVAREQDLLDTSRQIAEIEGRISGMDDRRARLDGELWEIETGIADRQRQLAALDADLKRIRMKRQELECDLQEQVAAHQSILERLRSGEDDLRSLQESAGQKSHDLDRLRSRRDLLDRIWYQGEGLHAGVAALLRAARRGDLDLPGLVGTVAESIRVPDEYETAIEVALGGRLQDVIVERWHDAESGIAYLRRTGAGRATFQPLDTVHAGRARSFEANGNGVVGVAARLVEHKPQVAPVVEQLLGRTLVVTDLDAVRRVIDARDGWTVVTLEGEIARPSGSVTGGTGARTAGLLARERERRGLPAKIEAAEQEIAKLAASIKRVSTGLDELRQAERELAGRIDSHRRELRQIEAESERLERQQAALCADLERSNAELGSLGERRAMLDRQEETERRTRDEMVARREKLRAERDDLQRQLSSEPRIEADALAALNVEIAATRERLRSAERERAGTERQIESAVSSIQQRSTEIERLEARRSELAEQASEAEREIRELESVIERKREAIAPLTAGRDEAVAAIASAEDDLEQRVNAVRAAERERDRAALDVARAGDEQVFLSERIRADLEIDDPASLVDKAGEAGERVEQEIRRLRERLRRMSAVGEDAISEYEEESERFEYLNGQLADVEGAAESLRRVLHDLRRQMAERFTATFAEVATEFERTFTRLFGGGTARLSHEIEDGEPGGVDIVARPPGKRLQGLNQLSGGERALTAVALLVAIQRVNPSPFCLLDEVDAALDESNVVRFRSELRDLTERTQFIVITHNRGTIEGADTLYGITMGDDSVSRVLSLRLDQALRTLEEDEELLESVI